MSLASELAAALTDLKARYEGAGTTNEQAAYHEGYRDARSDAAALARGSDALRRLEESRAALLASAGELLAVVEAANPYWHDRTDGIDARARAAIAGAAEAK